MKRLSNFSNFYILPSLSGLNTVAAELARHHAHHMQIHSTELSFVFEGTLKRKRLMLVSSFNPIAKERSRKKKPSCPKYRHLKTTTRHSEMK